MSANPRDVSSNAEALQSQRKEVARLETVCLQKRHHANTRLARLSRSPSSPSHASCAKRLFSRPHTREKCKIPSGTIETSGAILLLRPRYRPGRSNYARYTQCLLRIWTLWRRDEWRNWRQRGRLWLEKIVTRLGVCLYQFPIFRNAVWRDSHSDPKLEH